jgi:hypothetical protein
MLQEKISNILLNFYYNVKGNTFINYILEQS